MSAPVAGGLHDNPGPSAPKPDHRNADRSRRYRWERVAVGPITAELDLKALAASMGAKSAEMADSATAERATGYVVGDISPLGQKRQLPTVIDASASECETIFVSGGRRGLELELRPADLVRATGGRLASIARTR